MRRQRPVVGLDIGSSAIKLCVLKPQKGGFGLQAFGMLPLPHEAIVDGALMNASVVIDAIGELVRSHKVKIKEAAIAISGNGVIIKKINLPSMTPDELEDNIRWEAEQYIPFDINDVNIDVQILRPAPTPQAQMDVLLVAAKKEMINDYVQVVTEAGLVPTVCDVDTFAVENAYEGNYDTSAVETVVLINIGATKANLNVLSRGVSSFTRDLNIGGNVFSEEIQRRLAVSYDHAEELKVGGKGESRSLPREVEAAIQQVNEQVASEVQRSLDFYAATSADGQIGKIFLSGGSAKLESLGRTLSQRIGAPVEMLQPFRRLDVDESKFDIEHIKRLAPQAAVSVGLAMRYAGDK